MPARTIDGLPPHMDEILRFGDGALSIEDKLRLLEIIRSHGPEPAAVADRYMVEHIGRAHAALQSAGQNQNALEETFKRLTAPAWHPAIYTGIVQAPDGPMAMVVHGSNRLAVGTAEGIDLHSLAIGSEVWLGPEMNVILGASDGGVPPYGETAAFDRYTFDGRIVIRWRDEEIVVEQAGPLLSTDLTQGDLVRWDRATWLAFEKIERSEGNQFLLQDPPQVTSDRVGGHSKALKALREVVMIGLLDPGKAAKYDVDAGGSVMMVGPPGNGKTLMAQVIAYELSMMQGKSVKFAVIKPAQWWSPYVGETETNCRNLFKSLREAAADGYVVAFFDEIEAVGRIRGGSSGFHSDRFLSVMLTELQGFKRMGNIIVLCASNRKDLIDPALLERLSSTEIYVGRPSASQAREIVNIHNPPADVCPYNPNSSSAGDTRGQIIETCVSGIYSPNASTELCVVRLRDGSSRTVNARELASGRLLEQICRAARRRACVRDIEGGEPGVTVRDMEEAVCDALQKLTTTLTPYNIRAYLQDDLPQDVDVVSVEPIRRKVARPHKYLSAA